MEDEQRAKDAEAYMAWRLSEMRQAAGWSFTALSTKMEKAGCPIDRSSLQKIESGKPRRKITVNELVAFSQVFKTPISTFLGLEPEGEDDPLARSLERSERLAGIAIEATQEFHAHTGMLQELAARNQEFRERIQARFAETFFSQLTYPELFSDQSKFEAAVESSPILMTAFHILDGDVGPIEEHPLRIHLEDADDGE